MKSISWILILVNVIPIVYYTVKFFFVRIPAFCKKIARIVAHFYYHREWKDEPNGRTEAFMIFDTLAAIFFYLRILNGWELFYHLNKIFNPATGYDLPCSYYVNNAGGSFLLISLVFMTAKLQSNKPLNGFAVERLLLRKQFKKK